MPTLGEKIKQLRKQKGYTLKDVSKLANISSSFLSDIEHNRSNPSLERLTSIANALDTTTSYLLGEEKLNHILKILDDNNISLDEFDLERFDEFLKKYVLLHNNKQKT